MKVLGFDVETSKIPRHYPYSEGAFLVVASLAYPNGQTKVLTFNHQEVESINQAVCIQQIQEAFDEAEVITGHNLKFDLLWAKVLGIDFEKSKLHCTMVGDYLLSGQKRQSYTLDALAERAGIPLKLDAIKAFWESGCETDEIPLDVLLPYVRWDSQLALQLYQLQQPKIAKEGMRKLITLQMELMRVLVEVEHNGMAVCCNRMEEYICELGAKTRELEARLKEAFGWDVNLSSNDELSVALYGGTLARKEPVPYVATRKCKIKEPYLFTYKSGAQAIKYRTRTLDELIVKTRQEMVPEYRKGVGFKPPARGKAKKSEGAEDRESFWSVDKNTISQLRCRTKLQRLIKEKLVEYSNVRKAYESFLGKTDDAGLANKIHPDGCLHPKFNQTVAATGRLSSSDPNGQNFPRKGTSPIKKIFIPRHRGWKITNADLAQLEWRVAAFLSQDPVAIDEILHDIDYHRDNAIRFFGADPNLPNDHPDFKPLRTTAKVFGFRLLYGGTAYGMYLDGNMPNYSLEKWQEIVTAYYEKYAVLGQWQMNNIRTVNDNDGRLQMLSGRVFAFPELGPNNRGDKYSPNQVKNYPVQGTSADVVAMAMVTIRRKMRAARMQTLIIGQVHDALVFDGPAEEVRQLEAICLETFRDLPRLLGIFWNCNWNVPLDGDVESGDSYGETHALPLAA